MTFFGVSRGAGDSRIFRFPKVPKESEFGHPVYLELQSPGESSSADLVAQGFLR